MVAVCDTGSRPAKFEFALWVVGGPRSAEARHFFVPACYIERVARGGGQDWLPATAGGGLVLTGASTARSSRWDGLGWPGAAASVSGFDRLRAVVRLAHQLISGTSMTACHNPSCTADDRGNGFTLFTGVMYANPSLDARHPASGPLPGSSQCLLSSVRRRQTCTMPHWPWCCLRERRRSRHSARARSRAFAPWRRE